MKALTQTTIMIMLLCTGLAPANSSQVPSTPAAAGSVLQVEPGYVAQQPPAVPKLVPTATIVESYPAGFSVWPSERGTTGAVLVIPSTEMKPEEITAVMEDMSIMSRIFDKNLSQQRLIPTSTTAMSFYFRSDRNALPWLSSQQSSVTEAIYLEGFGALFLVGVDYPLSPLPQVQEEKLEEGVDTVWQDTKTEIYDPEAIDRRIKAERQKAEYNSERVEELQKTIIKTLKHAANIRGLKTDEFVTVTVRSSVPAVVITGTTMTSRTSRYGRARPTPTAPEPVTSKTEIPAEAGQATFLTIRAKKSDIDSFAKEQLNYDQFSQRVQTIKY